MTEPDDMADALDDREIDRIASRLENQLQDIEAAQIVRGLTPEALEGRGFTGPGPVPIDRALHREVTEKEKLIFEPGVEFHRIEDSVKFEDLVLTAFDLQADILKGRLIATRSAAEPAPFEAGPNVLAQSKGQAVQFLAAVNGKVLIHRNQLCILPSDADCTVLLRHSKGRMSVWMDCAPAAGRGLSLSLETVLSVLAKEGVCFGIQENKIREAVLLANQTRSKQAEVLVAAGLPPVKGQDGEPEFKFATDGQKPDFKIMSDGRIDYKNSANILMAKKGDLLAVLRDPGKGTPGKDVLGQPVPALDGQPARLTVGQGVSQSPDGSAFYASVNGSIVLNGHVLEIMEIFVVNSDIDFSTGNIQFNGSVLINGDIKEGFEVQATGDIIVLKNIESSRVLAGRDVKVTGGIVSKGSGLVSAGRDITADYAQNARLEAQGSVVLENFTVNSLIFTSRYLRMQSKRGTVLGGEVFAQKGVDVKVLGSENGKKTLVEVGTDFLVRKKKIELEEALKFAETNIARIDHALRPLMEIARSHPALFAAKKQLVHKTMAKKKELETQRTAMTAKLEDLNRRLNDPETCYIKVSAVCYPDVQIKIKEQRLCISKRLDRKIFLEDPKSGEIKIAPCS